MGWLRVELSEELLKELKKRKGKMTWESFFQMCLKALEGSCDPREVAIEMVSDAVKGDREIALILLLGLMSALEELHPQYSPEISKIRVVLRALVTKPEAFKRVYEEIIRNQ